MREKICVAGRLQVQFGRVLIARAFLSTYFTLFGSMATAPILLSGLLKPKC